MLEEIWDTVTLQEVLEAKPAWFNAKGLIAVEEHESLNSCLEKLLSNKLLSAPVMKLDRDDRNLMICTGIIDVQDVLQFLIKELGFIEGWTCWAPLQFKALLEDVKVCEVVNLSRGDPLVMANANSPLRSVVKFFASGLCHRCVIHLGAGGGGAGDKCNDFAVLSQIDVMHYLAHRIASSKDDQNLRDFLDGVRLQEKLCNRVTEDNNAMVTAQTDEPVVAVLKKMYSSEVSAVAIVDQNGKLQGNFSLSDVLYLEVATLSELNLPVVEFLQKYAQWALNPLSIQKEDGSLADAIVLFSALGLHRIWIVDSSVTEKFVPVGIVTLTDVFRILMKL